MHATLPTRLLALTLAAGGVACGASRGTLVEIDGLRARMPSGWVERPQVQPPRVRAFVLPRAPGDAHDAELMVLHYGRGYSGSAESGIDAAVARWQRLFAPPEGRSIAAVTQVETRRVRGVTMTIVNLQGTYLYRPDPGDTSVEPERRPEHRMIGVVLETRHGPYFLRMVGPARTIARHEQAFDRWLRSLN